MAKVSIRNFYYLDIRYWSLKRYKLYLRSYLSDAQNRNSCQTTNCSARETLEQYHHAAAEAVGAGGSRTNQREKSWLKRLKRHSEWEPLRRTNSTSSPLWFLKRYTPTSHLRIRTIYLTAVHLRERLEKKPHLPWLPKLTLEIAHLKYSGAPIQWKISI